MATVSRALELYFRVGNFLLINPSRVTKDPKTGRYISRKTHVALRVTIFTVQAMSLTTVVLNDWLGRESRRPFRVLVFTCYNLYLALGIATLWNHPGRLTNVMNSVLHLERSMKMAGIKMLPAGYVCIAAAVSLAYVVAHAVSVVLFVYLDIQHGVLKGHFRVHLDQASALIGRPNYDSDIVWILAYVIAIAAGYTLMGVLYLNMLIFVDSIILLYFPQSLLQNMKSSRVPLRSLTAIKLCRECLQMCELMGDALKGIVTFCFALIPYYALVMNLVLYQQDMPSIIRHSVTHGVFILILLTAADSNFKMKKVGALIADQASSIAVSATKTSRMDYNYNSSGDEETIRQLSVMLMQRLTADEYGVQARTFTITYGFVGNVAGLVLTYSIIMYQLRYGVDEV